MSKQSSRCNPQEALVVKARGHIFKVSRQHRAADEVGTDRYSPCKLRSCLDSHFDARLPATTTRSRCSLLCLAWRSPACRHRCELCCSSSRYIQFRARHPLEIPTSTYNILKLPKSTSRNKRWCHALWSGCGVAGVSDYCHYNNGFGPILCAKILDNRSARCTRMDVQR